MKYIHALKVDQFSYNDKIEAGDKIKIYGKETTVKGFYASYNDGLKRWETIIITDGRGDPFERSIDVIEVQEKYPPIKPPYPSGANVLVEALEKIQKEINLRSGITIDAEVNNMLNDIIDPALAQYNAATPQTPIDTEPEGIDLGQKLIDEMGNDPL